MCRLKGYDLEHGMRSTNERSSTLGGAGKVQFCLLESPNQAICLLESDSPSPWTLKSAGSCCERLILHQDNGEPARGIRRQDLGCSAPILWLRRRTRQGGRED